MKGSANEISKKIFYCDRQLNVSILELTSKSKTAF